MRRILNETVAHYNSGNRSINPKSKNDGSSCTYLPLEGVKSEGCAIGRMLPVVTKKEIQERGFNSGHGVETLFNKLSRVPKVFSGIDIIFLNEIQALHDSSLHWDNKGLSEIGEKKVKIIEDRFAL